MHVEFVLSGTFAEAADLPPGETYTVTFEGATVGDALAALTTERSALKPLVVNSDGRLRGHAALERNGEDVRNGEWLETPVADGDRLTLAPGVKGGC